MSELENNLKRALATLEKATVDFKLKQASFEEVSKLEALKELIKEQIPNENSMHSAREAR